jgi:hypothetical protein
MTNLRDPVASGTQGGHGGPTNERQNANMQPQGPKEQIQAFESYPKLSHLKL